MTEEQRIEAAKSRYEKEVNRAVEQPIEYTQGEHLAQSIADFAYMMAGKLLWRNTISTVDGFFGGEHRSLVGSVYADLIRLEVIEPIPYDSGSFRRFLDSSGNEFSARSDWYLPAMSDYTRSIAMLSSPQTVGAFMKPEVVNE